MKNNKTKKTTSSHVFDTSSDDKILAMGYGLHRKQIEELKVFCRNNHPTSIEIPK